MLSMHSNLTIYGIWIYVGSLGMIYGFVIRNTWVTEIRGTHIRFCIFFLLKVLLIYIYICILVQILCAMERKNSRILYSPDNKFARSHYNDLFSRISAKEISRVLCWWIIPLGHEKYHYCDVIMGMVASKITGLAIVCSTVYSDVDQRKHQSSVSLAFVWGIHRRPVNSSHKGPVTRKMFPFDDVIIVGVIY